MRVLWVPSIGLDISLVDRLAASVDYDIEYKVVWNNGPPGVFEDFQRRHPDWIIKDSPFGNIGCAGTWNEAAKVFPEDPAILIMNEDAWFLPGYLEQICACADVSANSPIVYLNDSRAYYCFVWTKIGREIFGTFDENFWPIYYEDCDMRARHRLFEERTGHKMAINYALRDLTPLPHGKPRTGGDNWAAVINGAGLFNRAYWLKKWGSFDFEKAQYPTPYNDHRLTFKNWEWYPAERAMRQPIWDTFINLPNPSIYT